MAQYIEMKQVPGGTVTAVDDRILYDYAINSGIIYGCGISYLGNNMIHINAGYGIIKGGLFEMQDHIEYVEYAESSNTPGQIYLHFDAAADDKLTIICETKSQAHEMIQNEDANYESGVYEIQLCTFVATTTALENVKQTFELAQMPIDVLDSLAEITANTTPGKAAGALAVKELNSNLVADNSVPFRFAYQDGKYGYKDGADTFCPFKSGNLYVSLNQTETIYGGTTSNYSTYGGVKYGKSPDMDFGVDGIDTIKIEVTTFSINQTKGFTILGVKDGNYTVLRNVTAVSTFTLDVSAYDQIKFICNYAPSTANGYFGAKIYSVD